MNIIKICGGLGNQLFQYAFGKAQSIYGADVAYDISFYDVTKKQKWPRPYRLDKFYTDVKIVSFLKQLRIKDNQKVCDLSLLRINNRNFDGYWQFLDYYKEIIPILREDFKVRDDFFIPEFYALRNKVEFSNSIALHVRRGDYLVQTWGILPNTYYFEAFTEMNKIQNRQYFIFSDDIEWCKKSFKPEYFLNAPIFVTLDDFLSFELMRLCKHQIIASSTFSWWAAILNDNVNKTVIAPSKWLGGSIATSQIYPSDWVLI